MGSVIVAWPAGRVPALRKIKVYDTSCPPVTWADALDWIVERLPAGRGGAARISAGEGCESLYALRRLLEHLGIEGGSYAVPRGQTAELPGFDPEGLDISVVNDTLTLSGNRCADDVEGATYHRRERRCGKFTRSFQLPFLVEGTDVEATFEQGVLKIELPRAEADKPKKIAVKAG